MATAPDPETANETESGPQGYLYLFLSLHLPALALGLGQGITTPVLPGFAESFGVGAGLAAMVFTAQLAGGVAISVPAGYAIDRLGRRQILIAGPLVTAASLFLTAFATADSFGLLLVYRVIGGAGQQMWMVSRLTVIADTGGSSRARQITQMFGVQRAGMLVGPLLGGFAATLWGATIAFVMHGAVALIGVIPSFFLIQESAPHQGAGSTGTGGRSTSFSWKLLLVRPIPILFTLQFLAALTRGGAIGGGTVFVFAVYAYGTNEATLGVLSSISAAIGIPLTLVAGQIMDRYGRKVAIIPGLLVFGLSMAFLGLIAALSWPFAAFIAAFIWMQVIAAYLSGSMQTLSTDLAPAQARGTFFGVGRMIGQAGFMANPLSFSILTALSGFATAFFFLFGTAAAAAAVLGLMIKETLQKPNDKG
jgi:MFS family permease